MMARPKEFDPDQALEAAMQAFWAKGYEATSMADLVAAMGLQKGSIYQAFGDKHSLYLAALTRYTNMTYRSFVSILDEAPTAYDGLVTLLSDTLVKQAVGPTFRNGCFVVNATVEVGVQDKEANAILRRQMARLEKHLAKKIKLAQDAGHIRDDIPAKTLAVQMGVMFYGMMSDCKNGNSAARTKKIAKTFFKTLEP